MPSAFESRIGPGLTKLRELFGKPVVYTKTDGTDVNIALGKVGAIKEELIERPGYGTLLRQRTLQVQLSDVPDPERGNSVRITEEGTDRWTVEEKLGVEAGEVTLLLVQPWRQERGGRINPR